VIPTGVFTVSTFNKVDTAFFKVDSGTVTNPYTVVEGTISNGLSVSTSGLTTFGFGVTITLTFNPKHSILKAGIIKVTIPITDIIVYD
jgi:hypothetical protein